MDTEQLTTPQFDRDAIVLKMDIPELDRSSTEGVAALTLGIQLVELLETVTSHYLKLGLTGDRVRLAKLALGLAANAMVAAFPTESADAPAVLPAASE